MAASLLGSIWAPVQSAWWQLWGSLAPCSPGSALMAYSAMQVYVRGSPVADLLAAIGDPGMSERPESCDVFEGALLRLIQQPGLAEPVQELPGPPRPMGLPHAGTCRLPEVTQFTMRFHWCSIAVTARVYCRYVSGFLYSV